MHIIIHFLGHNIRRLASIKDAGKMLISDCNYDTRLVMIYNLATLVPCQTIFSLDVQCINILNIFHQEWTIFITVKDAFRTYECVSH